MLVTKSAMVYYVLQIKRYQITHLDHDYNMSIISSQKLLRNSFDMDGAAGKSKGPKNEHGSCCYYAHYTLVLRLLIEFHSILTSGC